MSTHDRLRFSQRRRVRALTASACRERIKTTMEEEKKKKQNDDEDHGCLDGPAQPRRRRVRLVLDTLSTESTEFHICACVVGIHIPRAYCTCWCFVVVVTGVVGDAGCCLSAPARCRPVFVLFCGCVMKKLRFLWGVRNSTGDSVYKLSYIFRLK